MITDEVRAKYLPSIGIECHVQLKTKTKLFSAVNNDARDLGPNTAISPICLGLPGTLPVLNQAAVDLAIKAGLALNAKIADWIKFDRKHYFYPDLPKGYQITQFDYPIVGEGHITAPLPGTDKVVKVGIERAHLEEDAGKSTHPDGVSYSLVDLNRAGTPLLEIVSKPDMHTAQEARAYAHELYLTMMYADVSDVDLYHGNMRFDCNVSVALKESGKLGVRSETKNLNSFRAVEKAVEYEINRQIGELERGRKIVQETRGWNDAKQKTFSQRTKEDAHDYRYFPEPDLPPYTITADKIETAKQSLGRLPADIRADFTKRGVKPEQVEILLERKHLMGLVESVDKQHLKRVVNWLTGEVIALIDQFGDESQLQTSSLEALSGLVEAGKLSSTGAKDVLAELYKHGGDAAKIADEKGLIQLSDDGAIEKYVQEVIAENESAAQDVRNGEMKAIGFLVGSVMKKSQGRANPQKVNELLRQKLS